MAKQTKEEMVKVAIEYDAAKKTQKEQNKVVKGLQEQLQIYMGDKTHIDLGDFGFNYGFSDPEDKVDTELLKTKYPKIYAACLVPGTPKRTFTYKKNKPTK
jgi:hypothetical protein